MTGIPPLTSSSLLELYLCLPDSVDINSDHQFMLAAINFERLSA